MVVVAALVVAVLWIERPGICTDLGCDDGVYYSIPDEVYMAWGATPQVPVVVETCIEDECRIVEVVVDENGVARRDGGEVRLEEGTLAVDEVYNLSLRVTDQSGTVVYSRSDSGVTLTEFEPNGPDCPPTCAAWFLALEPQDLGL